ncbi:hypothetical protein TNCV_2956661 [Trichonephila clavipes]|nr:hypothetical protein TNCV_2956661 [Trichonephila clavipes]
MLIVLFGIVSFDTLTFEKQTKFHTVAIKFEHRGTLNIHRTANPLVRLVEGEERWEATHHTQVYWQQYGQGRESVPGVVESQIRNLVPPCRETDEAVEAQNTPAGNVWKFGEICVSSGVVLVI